MIRTIAFSIVAIIAFIFGCVLKSEANIHCFTAWGVTLLSIFAAYFSWESWKINTNFWSAVTGKYAK